MPRRYYDYLPDSGYEIFHQVSTVGSWILLLGMLVMAVNLFASLKSGAEAPANPWEARSLEWLTQSPPIEHNFHEIPTVVEGPYEFPVATATTTQGAASSDS